MRNEHIDRNREGWDKRTRVHVKSEMYDVAGFLRGENKLKEIELGILGNVEGLQLLHLQCHFGVDTLSWARMGAEVTGVDFSPVAIEEARSISRKADIGAEFICSELYDYGELAKPVFDIVYVSYGALNWLPDIGGWAQVVAKSLRSGGRLVLVEFHPAYDLASGYSYFEQDAPDVEEEGTYTENCTGETSLLSCWSHSLGEVVSAIIEAGLRVDCLKEYPFSPCDCIDGSLETEVGRHVKLSAGGQPIPLVYSVEATKV